MLLKVAIIGCGNIASSYDTKESPFIYSHAKAFTHNQSTELIAACDPDKKKRENFASLWGHDISLYKDIRELLANHKDIDILSICSPTELHEEHLTLALYTDIRYVICEKPLSNNADMGYVSQLVKKYSFAKKYLVVNHILRWDPAIKKIQTEVVKKIQEIQTVNVIYAKGLKHNGIHVVDLTLFFFGEPKKIIKLKETFENKDDNNVDFVFLYDEFSVNFSGLLEKNYSIFEYKIYLSNEAIEITNLTNTIRRFHVVNHEFLKGYKKLSTDSTDIETNQDVSMKNVIDDIVNSAINNQPPSFTPIESLKSLEYIHKINKCKITT